MRYLAIRFAQAALIVAGNFILYLCPSSVVAWRLFPGNEAQPADLTEYCFSASRAVWD